MTTTHAARPLVTTGTAGWRIGFDRAQRIGAIIGMALCALQVAFAAYGFWVSTQSGGDEAVGRAAFTMHTVTGEVLQYLAAALLVCGLLARSGWKCWVLPLVMAVLLFAVQGPLVGLGFGVSAWFGALHAFDGMLITAGFVWLGVDRMLYPLR
ncbi:hypothetical protein ET475_10940 [Microbacterium protaetiae]|uniref:DUF4386 family protein n=1 Tax=Microbacterium protaetiae TaxID=2509458 RepID=A0A4P6EDV7_9MICO|nr:hypothetical protein [Microbacterium protaetiae]QAY60452.1 hypothetical protein ET475_10940 [Microbacterium protaetiae]